MQRLPDLIASEVIGFADDNGRVAEVQINGKTTSGSDYWILIHANNATFRMSTAEDTTEYELSGLDIYAPESLLNEEMPEGITSLTIKHGSHAYHGTVRGTYRAISDFVRDNWTDGSDDADEQLAMWMDLAVPVQS